MKEIGHEERMCDSCEEKMVGLLLWPRPIYARERKCLAKNIIPSSINLMLPKSLQTQADEETAIAFPLLRISVVLCKECSLKDREETLKAIAEKPRILEEAIESHQIDIDELIHEISEAEEKKEALAKEMKKVDERIYSNKNSLARSQRLIKRIKEDRLKIG